MLSSNGGAVLCGLEGGSAKGEDIDGRKCCCTAGTAYDSIEVASLTGCQVVRRDEDSDASNNVFEPAR